MTVDLFLELILIGVFISGFILGYLAGKRACNELVLKMIHFEKAVSLLILLVYLWLVTQGHTIDTTFAYFAMGVGSHLVGIDLGNLFNKYMPKNVKKSN